MVILVCLGVDTRSTFEIPAETRRVGKTEQWEEQNAANKWIDYKGDIRWYDLFGWGTGDEWNKTNTDSTAYAIYTDWGNN